MGRATKYICETCGARNANGRNGHRLCAPCRVSSRERDGSARAKRCAYLKAWRAAHPGYVLSKNRAYYQANGEKCREQSRAWVAAHAEHARQRDAEYHRLRREARNARARAYYAANAERLRAYATEYRLAHPLERMVHHETRRARKMGRNGAGVTAVEWRAILEYFGHRCAYCLRADVKLQQEHVDPLARGGAHSPENVVPACAFCNNSKHNRPVWSMLGRAA